MLLLQVKLAHRILRAELPCLPTCVSHKRPILINLFLACYFALTEFLLRRGMENLNFSKSRHRVSDSNLKPWVQVPKWVQAGFESWHMGSSPNLCSGQVQAVNTVSFSSKIQTKQCYRNQYLAVCKALEFCLRSNQLLTIRSLVYLKKLIYIYIFTHTYIHIHFSKNTIIIYFPNKLENEKIYNIKMWGTISRFHICREISTLFKQY